MKLSTAFAHFIHFIKKYRIYSFVLIGGIGIGSLAVYFYIDSLQFPFFGETLPDGYANALRARFAKKHVIGAPWTQCDVHAFKDLQGYLADGGVADKYFKDNPEAGYIQGIALYLGRSARDTTYIGKKNVLLPKKYTVILMPVYYTLKDTLIHLKHPDRDTTVKVIDKLDSPLDHGRTGYPEQNCDDKVLLSGNSGYDLGSTYP